MRDRHSSDPNVDPRDIDEDEAELGLEDELEAEDDEAVRTEVVGGLVGDEDDALPPEGDENRVGIVLDENEADQSEAGGMEHFACAFCGEENEVFVDRTASKRQQFTEDCEVCCRPNLVSVFIDPDGGTWVDAEREDEA